MTVTACLLPHNVPGFAGRYQPCRCRKHECQCFANHHKGNLNEFEIVPPSAPAARESSYPTVSTLRCRTAEPASQWKRAPAPCPPRALRDSFGGWALLEDLARIGVWARTQASPRADICNPRCHGGVLHVQTLQFSGLSRGKQKYTAVAFRLLSTTPPCPSSMSLNGY
jgi:hypothetical protein